MQIPHVFKEAIVYICNKDEDGDYDLKGTGFLTTATVRGVGFFYVVSAAHVIEKFPEDAESVFLRINLSSGGFDYHETKKRHWAKHLNDTQADIAACPIEINMDWKFAHIGLALSADDEIIAKHAIGIGDEIFFIGLFGNHPGEENNIPVIRVGHIAAMPEEPVAGKNGKLDAYLIDVPALKGFSGSPVMVYLSGTRYIDRKPVMYEYPKIFLLGIVHGHFDPTGFSMVVPVQKITEVIYLSYLNLMNNSIDAMISHRDAVRQSKPIID